MLCSSCGNPVEGAFCSRCGARVQPPAPQAPPQYAPPAGAGPAAPHAGPVVPPASPYWHHIYIPRVANHIQLVAILWLVYAAYRVVTGLFASLLMFGFSTHSFLDRLGPEHSFPFAPFAPFMGTIAVLLVIKTIIAFALAVVTGVALLQRKTWGRTLAIIAAVLALLTFPVGTALGIYTLWVLAPTPSGHEYEALAQRT